MSLRRLPMRCTPKSSFVAGLAYLPLAPDLRREHLGKGLLVVKFRGGRTRVYLADSWLYGVLCAPQRRSR